MRVSSLSDARVQRLVGRHFVPVWVSRDRYQLADAGRDERALVARMDETRRAKKLDGGAVCVYVTSADGDTIATLPVQKASKPDLLVAFLEKLVADEKIAPREPAKAAVAPPPKAKGKARLFAVRTRFDAGENRGTSRDLVELSEAEWSAFLPPDAAKVGRTWKVSAGVAEKLLRHAYPPLPHWDAKLARLASCEMSATLAAIGEDHTTVRLAGKLDLIYPYKGERTDGRLTADLVGVVRCREGRLVSLALVSDGGEYVWHWQGKPQTKPATSAVELLP